MGMGGPRVPGVRWREGQGVTRTAHVPYACGMPATQTLHHVGCSAGLSGSIGARGRPTSPTLHTQPLTARPTLTRRTHTARPPASWAPR